MISPKCSTICPVWACRCGISIWRPTIGDLCDEPRHGSVGWRWLCFGVRNLSRCAADSTVAAFQLEGMAVVGFTGFIEQLHQCPQLPRRRGHFLGEEVLREGVYVFFFGPHAGTSTGIVRLSCGSFRGRFGQQFIHRNGQQFPYRSGRWLDPIDTCREYGGFSYIPVAWPDAKGNLGLFGGTDTYDGFNDLWQYQVQ